MNDPDDLPGALPAEELRFRAGAATAVMAQLAVERPVALQYNGISHAVMLATPRDLDDFALGFSLAEGIVTRPSELHGVEVSEGPGGVTLDITVAAEAFVHLKERRRTLAGRTGCGICGTESLDQVLRPVAVLAAGTWTLAPAALARATGALAQSQPLARRTGATHGAAWCRPDGQILLVREDVGRHNALDKLIGALARAAMGTTEGFVLVTSRASVEMVQKAASAGIGVLAAISAPTTLACDQARSWGLTLIGFARGEDFSVYTHPQRVRC